MKRFIETVAGVVFVRSRNVRTCTATGQKNIGCVTPDGVMYLYLHTAATATAVVAYREVCGEWSRECRWEAPHTHMHTQHTAIPLGTDYNNSQYCCSSVWWRCLILQQ